MQVGETVEAQYVSVEDEEQLTDAPVAALHDNGENKRQQCQWKACLLPLLFMLVINIL